MRLRLSASGVSLPVSTTVSIYALQTALRTAHCTLAARVRHAASAMSAGARRPAAGAKPRAFCSGSRLLCLALAMGVFVWLSVAVAVLGGGDATAAEPAPAHSNAAREMHGRPLNSPGPVVKASPRALRSRARARTRARTHARTPPMLLVPAATADSSSSCCSCRRRGAHHRSPSMLAPPLQVRPTACT